MGCEQSRLDVASNEEYEAAVFRRNELQNHLNSLLVDLNTFQEKFSAEEMNGSTDESTEIAHESERNIIENTFNNKGNLSRIGATGKYYCGQDLVPPCECCSSSCGPSSGCNCVDCMLLDVKARNLPKSYLVNKLGRIARKNESGKVYCGASVLRDNDESDGWCGPNNGPQCEACQILEQHWDTRYGELYKD
jgi:hypothetical protein